MTGLRSEEEAVEQAVEGVPHDRRITREAPADPAARERCARDMVRSLFAQGCEYYRVAWEKERGILVADGWFERPEVYGRYVPPGLEPKSGMAMDLTPKDRARLRNVVRRTHRSFFRDEPSTAMLDELIDSLGPRVAAKMVRKAVDEHRVG